MSSAGPVADTLRLSVLQYAPRWEDRDANLAVLDGMLASMDPADVLLLPEMFATGFSMRTNVVTEPSEGPVWQWMRQKAAETGALVAGSVAVTEGGRSYNRMYGVYPSGETVYYDKRHLFRMGKEHLHYVPGTERTVWHWKGWRLLPQVCYDLRFPVWSRNRNDYDVALYATNWPAPRSGVLQTLAAARALENACYVAFTNRLGEDAGGISYAGASCIIDYKGQPLAALEDAPGIAAAELSRAGLEQFRGRFPVWMDADFFTVQG